MKTATKSRKTEDVLSEDPIDRTERWVVKLNGMTAEELKGEVARCQKEFYRMPESDMLRLTPDLGEVPATNELSEESDAETVAKVQELVSFIKGRFGKRCMDAAHAIMDGCLTGAEIGARMGVARQTADEHLENLRSPDVKEKALSLGLVTRGAFERALKMAKALESKPKAKKVTKRKVVRKKAARK